jgi:hypothetical protein
MPLIARFVLGLVGDAIFDTTAARVRAYESEIDRYFDERGFRIPGSTRAQRSS